MTENTFPELITERLRLRKLRESDWEEISYLRSDKEINKLVKRPSAETKEEALAFITKITAGVDNEQPFYWVITEKTDDTMIGSISLWNFSEDLKKAEVGYDLGTKFHRKGIMNESLEHVLTFGFNELNLDSFEACTHKENGSSRKLLERNGFRLVEGKTDDDNPENIIYELRKSN